jgi:hypothetical protein
MVFDPSLFERQRRNLQQNFAQQSALNTYQRYLAQQQGERGIRDIEESAFGTRREVPRLTSSFARRGLTGQGVRSGVFNRALNEYGQQRARELGEGQQSLADALRGFDLRQGQYLSGYETSLADLEADKTRQIAQDAQALLTLR